MTIAGIEKCFEIHLTGHFWVRSFIIQGLPLVELMVYTARVLSCSGPFSKVPVFLCSVSMAFMFLPRGSMKPSFFGGGGTKVQMAVKT